MFGSWQRYQTRRTMLYGYIRGIVLFKTIKNSKRRNKGNLKSKTK